MAAVITWGIEMSGPNWGAGGSSLGVFKTEKECRDALPDVFEKNPTATKVSCLKISGDAKGNGEVIDRLYFGRGMVIINYEQ